MAHPSKDKGNRFEREIVRTFQDFGFDASRAYASNGESLGRHHSVDVLAEVFGVELPISAKRRKSIASYLLPTEEAPIVITREDRGEPIIIMTLDDFFDILYSIRL